MQTYYEISSVFFDFLLAPLGHEWFMFDLILWPLAMGIIAIVAFKYTSNQKGIAKVKRALSMHLLEIRLFKDDLAQVVKSTVMIVLKNPIYIGHNLLPVAVMIVPMIGVMTQLVAHYGYDAAEPGSTELLRVVLDPEGPVTSMQVSLKLPEGVSLDAPPVRTSDRQVFWRLRADQPGDHILEITVAGETLEKSWAVGGELRKIGVKRFRNWESFLYPSEAPIPASSPVMSIELATHVRPLAYLPDGEFGILMWFFVVSMVGAFALKDFFGVTL